MIFGILSHLFERFCAGVAAWRDEHDEPPPKPEVCGHFMTVRFGTERTCNLPAGHGGKHHEGPPGERSLGEVDCDGCREWRGPVEALIKHYERCSARVPCPECAIPYPPQILDNHLNGHCASKRLCGGCRQMIPYWHVVKHSLDGCPKTPATKNESKGPTTPMSSQDPHETIEAMMVEIEDVMFKDALTLVRLPRYDGFAISRVARVYSMAGGALVELAQFLGRGGYMEVGLPGRSMSVHRLVASAFLPPPLPHQIVVRHLDGTRFNNHPSNLAWGTYQDNTNDLMKVGCPWRGEANCHAKLTDEAVLEIRNAVLVHRERPGSVAKRMGVSAALVSMVVRGDIWKHVGGPTRASLRTMALRTHNAKLTDDDVVEIKRAKAAGATSKELAAKYGVTYYHINAICNGQWRGPKPPVQGDEK